MSNEISSLLRALISLTGHSVFDQGQLREIIGKKSEKLILAYNLCDGTNTQQEIARKVKLDPSNFSKAVGRWIEAGILFRVESDDKTMLLHVYPLP
ncbi:MAG: helix-turn-helix domain-containing protein [Alphaproteobacteria bacterium]|nr:helix-turn-helix domain-containing protein [Alphaproteobacteria bacterium]